ncbi:hypothetical protein ACE6H2_010462 [Prunus campanulata]
MYIHRASSARIRQGYICLHVWLPGFSPAYLFNLSAQVYGQPFPQLPSDMVILSFFPVYIYD